MSFKNPLWGAPRIHGELLRLGIDVAQSTVSICMVPRRDRPSQTWKAFSFELPRLEAVAQRVDEKRQLPSSTGIMF